MWRELDVGNFPFQVLHCGDGPGHRLHTQPTLCPQGHQAGQRTPRRVLEINESSEKN
jgi:hypothetical protein